jgi:hypothetical protein
VYKTQILQDLQPADNLKCRNFATKMLEHIDNDNTYLSKVMFSDETTLHLSGYVNKQNMQNIYIIT